MKALRSLPLATFSLVFVCLAASGCTSSGSERGHIPATGGSGGSSGSGGGTPPTETGGTVGTGSGGSGGSGGSTGGSGGSPVDAGTVSDGAASDSATPATGDGGAPAASDELPACVRTVNVTDTATLMTAVGAAMAGDCIVAADGAYGALSITAKGTATAPIQIKAANLLKATGGVLKVTDSSYVVVQGFALGGILVVNSSYARITRSSVKGTSAGGVGNIWVRVEEQKGCSSGCSNTPPGKSDHTRIDHCDIGGGSAGSSDVINNTGLSTYTQFDHNYVHDVSGDHIITAGCCGPTFDYHDTFSIFEFNVFDKVSVGSAEMLSIKDSATTFRYNTVRNHDGDVDIRAGKHDEIYGNFIFSPGGGIRMYEDDHKIYNNYVQTGTALNMGAANGIHAGVTNATVVFNTFIGGVSLSGSGNTFTNNIVTGGGGGGAGNLTGSAASLGLVQMGDIMTLMTGSKAIGAAMGKFDFVTDDITGTPRGDKPDIGAEQFAASKGMRKPLTAADVGPMAP